MARVDTYLPDDLARRAREAGLNVSGIAQEALEREVGAPDVGTWLAEFEPTAAQGLDTHAGTIEAVDVVRAEAGGDFPPGHDMNRSVTERLVLDASALVDVLTDGPAADWVARRVHGCQLAAPAPMRAEVLSALGRRARGGIWSVADVETAVGEVADAKVAAHPLDGLIVGAWARRASLRLADAFCVELADQLGTVVVTTDVRLARVTSLAVAPAD